MKKEIEAKSRCKKHNFAFDDKKFWCIKCGLIEIRETPTESQRNRLSHFDGVML